MMRVRFITLPKLGEIDELNLRKRFQIGRTYELPLQFATVLMIAGYAEGSDADQAVATDEPLRVRKRSSEDLV